MPLIGPLSAKERKQAKDLYGMPSEVSAVAVKVFTKPVRFKGGQIRMSVETRRILDELVIAETARTKVLQNREKMLDKVVRHWAVMRDMQSWSSFAEFVNQEEGVKHL